MGVFWYGVETGVSKRMQTCIGVQMYFILSSEALIILHASLIADQRTGNVFHDFNGVDATRRK